MKEAGVRPDQVDLAVIPFKYGAPQHSLKGESKDLALKIANQLNVAQTTVHRWIKTLQSFYFCFTIKPWHTNTRRAIRKMPKMYWSEELRKSTIS